MIITIIYHIILYGLFFGDRTMYLWKTWDDGVFCFQLGQVSRFVDYSHYFSISTQTMRWEWESVPFPCHCLKSPVCLFACLFVCLFVCLLDDTTTVVFFWNSVKPIGQPGPGSQGPCMMGCGAMPQGPCSYGAMMGSNGQMQPVPRHDPLAQRWLVYNGLYVYKN